MTTNESETKRKPRRSIGRFTEPTHRLNGMEIPQAVNDALEKEAERQGVTKTVVRRQALERLLCWVNGEEEVAQ